MSRLRVTDAQVEAAWADRDTPITVSARALGVCSQAIHARAAKLRLPPRLPLRKRTKKQLHQARLRAERRLEEMARG